MEGSTWDENASPIVPAQGTRPKVDSGTLEINTIPVELLTEILATLPQKELVPCRKVCKRWRDTIDQHCPMTNIILEKNDKFLDRKLNLRISSCIVSDFSNHNPNISLTHPQSIKSIEFHHEFPREINVENARGLLSQVNPFVHSLLLDCEYFETNILSESYQFPRIRKLTIGRIIDGYSDYMHDDLKILFSHRFPLLENLTLQFMYTNEKLMDDFFNFLAKHRRTIRHLTVNIYYACIDNPLAGVTQVFTLSKEVNLLAKELQLESLELVLSPKYLPAWTPILQSQNKLISLTVRCYEEFFGQGSVPFCTFRPAISSCFSTLGKVALQNISLVGGTSLDLSVFREAINLTELELERIRGFQMHSTSKLNIVEIKNLSSIPLSSLKVLLISEFVCSSEELQILVDNAPILEHLYLHNVRAPPTSPLFCRTGVHGGIIQSFVEKETKMSLTVSGRMNYSSIVENDKLEVVRYLYPVMILDFDTDELFVRHFWSFVP